LLKRGYTEVSKIENLRGRTVVIELLSALEKPASIIKAETRNTSARGHKSSAVYILPSKLMASRDKDQFRRKQRRCRTCGNLFRAYIEGLPGGRVSESR
jgi:hypothetical protein